MQFLIIWAENLPHEIAWFVPRLQTGWRGVGVALVVLQLRAAAAALLLRAQSRTAPRPARRGGGALLAAHALDSGLAGRCPRSTLTRLAVWWLAPLCLTGMALLLFGADGRGAGLR